MTDARRAYDDLPPRVTTVNQLISYNMAYWRQARGVTQEELGVLMGAFTGKPWSKATVSAAERGWDGKRIRQFDADELLALAEVLEVPFAGLFLPPTDDGVDSRLAIVTNQGRSPDEAMHVGDLLYYLVPDALEGDQSDTAAEITRLYTNRLESAINFFFGDEASSRIYRTNGTPAFGRALRLGDLDMQRNILRQILGEVEREAAALETERISKGDVVDQAQKRAEEVEAIRAGVLGATEIREPAALMLRLETAVHVDALRLGRIDSPRVAQELGERLLASESPAIRELGQGLLDAKLKAADYRTPWLRLADQISMALNDGAALDLVKRVAERVRAGQPAHLAAAEFGITPSHLHMLTFRYGPKYRKTIFPDLPALPEALLDGGDDE